MYHHGQDTDSTKLINCVFVGNSVTRDGGGIYIYKESSPILINCTFGRNTAGEDGGGIYSRGVTPMVTNCILWENTDSGGMDESAQIYGDTPDINYSCIQGWTGSLGGTGNIGDDPLFVDIDGSDNVLSTEDDNPRLLAGSACLDAGDNSAIPPSVPTDFDGNPRIVNGTVEMGAYEGANQGFLLNTQSVTIAEGMTAGFTVALAMAPLETVEVSVANEWGDPDITVTFGGTLTFDLSNYWEPQMVTLAAAEDADNLDGIALIQVSTPGIITAGVTVT
jgi:parallel beta-helix repeat protein